MGSLDLHRLLEPLRLDRPVPGLVPTRLLHAREPSPYGQFLSEEQVAALWRREGGEGDPPAWFPLGGEDTPAGTLWTLAFCPADAAVLGRHPAPALLPEALWVLRLQAHEAPAGWSRARTARGASLWIGLWEGGSCRRLARVAPGEAAREAAFQARRWPAGAQAPGREVAWREPSPREARALLEAEPQGSLLPEPVARARREAREDRRARRALAALAAALALGTAGLWAWTLAAQHRLEAARARTRGLAPVLERLERLTRERERGILALRARPALLAPAPAVDRWLGRILSSVPPARLEGLRLQGGDSTAASVRLDLEVDGWGELNPLLERLRALPGVRAARFESQSRAEGKVRAQAVLEGAVP